MNEGYEDLDLGIEEPPKRTAKSMKKPTNTAAVDELDLDIEVEAPITPTQFIDPEMDRDNWPTILIEMEDGKPNYEYVSASGTMKNGKPFGHQLQIMRGVSVQVPPSIVYCLQDAVATHHVPRTDPANGKMRLERQDRSAVPWRLIKTGKYIK